MSKFWGLTVGVVLIVIGVVGLIFLGPLVAFVKQRRRARWGDTRMGDRSVRNASRASQGAGLVVFIVLGVVVIVQALNR